MKSTNDNLNEFKWGEVIEKILVESGLSLSAFSRKVGYSRQYLYELLKTKGAGSARKMQLDTLKTICDATGYGLERLLVEAGYLPQPTKDGSPNTVVIVKQGGMKSTYALDEEGAALLEKVVDALSRAAQSRA